jgi:hypothetical protein
MEILKGLFIDWKLDIWANVLEVIGFLVTVATIVISLRVKSEVAQLKLNYLFKARLPDHRTKLREKADSLKNHLRTYEDSIEEIKEVLVMIEAELQSLSEKLQGRELKTVKHLISFISMKRNNRFRVKRDDESKLIVFIKQYVPIPFETSCADGWAIYTEVSGVVERIGNLLTDRTTSL